MKVTGFGLLVFIAACGLLLVTLSGCGPTYPKEKIPEAIVDLCNKEYKVIVDTKVSGSTVVVYLPIEDLFDSVLNLSSAASKKINDVILSVSRVTLSTDAKFDFYVVIAQDPKTPEVEIVYIRYVDDVKRFFLGAISRDEYIRRALIVLRTPPQAERERILKDLFSKLKIENSDEIIKEYLNKEENVSGIGEISYWDRKFFIKEIGLAEFLASQINERIKMAFRQEKDLNKWYEIKSSEGKFIVRQNRSLFVFNVNIADRVTPLYLDSGIELGAERKRVLVFEKLFGVIKEVLQAYKFSDFNRVEVSIPSGSKVITKSELWKFKGPNRKIEGALDAGD